MGDLRRFSALRRRLNALQQESYTYARVLENTDWRGNDHAAELQANTARLATLEEEAADIEFLLDYYERSILKAQAMIISPYTVLMILGIIVALFVSTTLVAGILAGVIRVG